MYTKMSNSSRQAAPMWTREQSIHTHNSAFLKTQLKTSQISNKGGTRSLCKSPDPQNKGQRTTNRVSEHPITPQLNEGIK